MKGRITIHGKHAKGAGMEVYRNDELVFDDMIISDPLLGGSMEKSGQRILASFYVDLDPTCHIDEYRIVCRNGEVEIGYVHEHFNKDVNQYAYPELRREIYKYRLENIQWRLHQYNYYEKKDYQMIDNKINVRINDEPQVIELEEGTCIEGWLFKLNDGDVITFGVDYLTPKDPISFLVDCQPGIEYFNRNVL